MNWNLDYRWTKESEKPVKNFNLRICPKCKHLTYSLIWDQYGKYYKCSHCNYDSAALYTTKNKY